MRVRRTWTADDVVPVIESVVAERGAPTHVRMDDGSELVAWALRDWCRLHGSNTSYIEPGSPWENPVVESFNGRARDVLLNVETSPPSSRPMSSKPGGSGTSPAGNGRVPWARRRRAR